MNNSDNDKTMATERSQKQNEKEQDTNKLEKRVNILFEAMMKELGGRWVPPPKGVEVWIFENPKEPLKKEEEDQNE